MRVMKDDLNPGNANLPIGVSQNADQEIGVPGRQPECYFGRYTPDFFDFVLFHYVTIGVEELDQTRLTPLLRLKYHDSISDAVAVLGKPEEIGKIFTGFQKYLYLDLYTA